MADKIQPLEASPRARVELSQAEPGVTLDFLRWWISEATARAEERANSEAA